MARALLKRLFSTFARGLPGAGLLLLRLVAGVSIIVHSNPGIAGNYASTGAALLWLAAGILLLVGLWTPISGVTVAAFSLWRSASESGDPWTGILVATIGAALALLGPGAWSVDSRLFGWKRIDLPRRER